MSCSWCTEKFLPNNPITEAGNFQITSLAATNLTNIRRYGRRMRVYAEVSLKGVEDSDSVTVKTAVDKEGDTDPTWDNLDCEFTVEETSVLTVKLYCDRTRGDKCIGSAEIHVSRLLLEKPVETEAPAVYNEGNWSLKMKYKTSLSTQPYYRW